MNPRQLLRRASVAVCTAAVLLPALVALPTEANADPPLDAVEQRLQQERRELAETEARKAAALAEVRSSDRRRQAFDETLDALEDDLGGAQIELDNAQRALDATTAQLATTQAELTQAETDLAAQRQLFAARTRASYMRGGAELGFGSALLASRDVAEVGVALKYVRAVLARDHERVIRIDGLTRTVSAAIGELDVIRGRQAALQERAATERNRIAGLVDRQEELVAQASAEAERHRLLVVRLESDADTSEALIADLEAEGRRLAGELRQREAQAAAAARASSSGTSRAPAVVAPSPRRPGQLLMPVQGRLTSPFGYRIHPISGRRKMHSGIDIAAPTGTPIAAPADGVVVSAGWRGGLGYATVVDHGGGMATVYAHQARILVRAGQSVTRGQRIGDVGTTGYSTGPHLHFEVRINGTPTDPMRYL